MQMKDSSWQSRYDTTVNSYETRITALKEEIDRIRGELADMRTKQIDHGDPIAVVHKAQQIKEALGVGSSSDSGAQGMGLSGMPPAPFDWNTGFEKLMEEGPQWLDKLGDLWEGRQRRREQTQAELHQALQQPHHAIHA